MYRDLVCIGVGFPFTPFRAQDQKCRRQCNKRQPHQSPNDAPVHHRLLYLQREGELRRSLPALHADGELPATQDPNGKVHVVEVRGRQRMEGVQRTHRSAIWRLGRHRNISVGNQTSAGDVQQEHRQMRITPHQLSGNGPHADLVRPLLAFIHLRNSSTVGAGLGRCPQPEEEGAGQAPKQRRKPRLHNGLGPAHGIQWHTHLFHRAAQQRRDRDGTRERNDNVVTSRRSGGLWEAADRGRGQA